MRNTTQWSAQLNQLPAERLIPFLNCSLSSRWEQWKEAERRMSGRQQVTQYCVWVCVWAWQHLTQQEGALSQAFFPDKTQCTKQGQQGSIVAPKQKSAEPAGRQRQRQPGQNKRSPLHSPRPHGLLPRFTAGAEYQTGRVDKRCREGVCCVYLAAAW